MHSLAPSEVLFGKYHVLRRIAHGGTSVIYEGVCMDGAGRVAIKQLACGAESTEFPEEYRLFQAEFERLSILSHPGLPAALDFFEEDGRCYLVEEFIEGRTLQDELDLEGRLPWNRALQLLLPLLDVLAYLHQNGLIYRDLKPRNVILGRDGRIRLIDLGAARVWKPHATRDTIELGTPGYASPEHYGGAQTDVRSDVYTVGVLLHYMVSGHDPEHGEPWKLPPLQNDVPLAVSRAVERATQLAPQDRFATIEQMRAALEPALPVPHLHRETSPFSSVLQKRVLSFPHAAEYDGGLHEAESACWTLVCVTGLTGLTLSWYSVLLLAVIAGIRRMRTTRSVAAWQRLNSLTAEVEVKGFSIRQSGKPLTTAWKDVTTILMVRSSGILMRADYIVEATTGNVFLDAAWPGTKQLIDEIVASTQLQYNVHDANSLSDQRVVWRRHQ